MPGLGVPPIGRWAQRIQAPAQTGQTCARNPYDVERCRELPQVAAAAPV